MRSLFRLMLTAVLGVFATHSVANAAVIFDSYTSPGSGVQSATSTGALASNAQSGLSGILFGNARTVDVTRFAGSGAASIDVNTTLPGGVTVNNALGTGSTANVTYDFAAQGFALNFSPVGTLTVTDAQRDVGPVMLGVTLFNGGSSYSIPSQSITATGPGTDLTFSLAGVPVGILSNVTKLQLTIDTSTGGGTAGSDVGFGPVHLDQTPQLVPPVPEPASMATLGLVGLIGGIAARRKLKAKAAAQA